MISLPNDVVSYINCSFAKIAGEKHFANAPTNTPIQATGVREGVMARDMARAKARKFEQASASVSTSPTTPTPAFLKPPDISGEDETSFNEKQSEKQSEKNILEPKLENEGSECPTKLMKHSETVHEKIKPEIFTEIVKEKIKRNKCFNCRRTFGKEIEFRKHIFSCQKEIQELSFDCLWCNFSSKTKWKLQKHILRVHDKNYPFKCAFCQVKYGLQSSLKRHFTRVH